MRSDPTLKRYYNKINKKFFANELPRNVCVRYLSELEKAEFEETYYAWTSKGEGRHKYVIVICKKKNPGITAVLATLVHECIHVKTEMKDAHGPAFEAVRQTLSDRGIYKKHALLRDLTIF